MPLFVWLRFHLLITIFQFVFGNSLLLFMHQILFFLLCVIRTLHILQYKNHIHLIMAWNWVRFISVEQKKIEIYTMISFDVWLFNYVNKIGTLALTIWIIWVYIFSLTLFSAQRRINSFRVVITTHDSICWCCCVCFFSFHTLICLICLIIF